MKTYSSLSKFGVWLGVTALVSQVSNNPELSTSLSAIGVVNLDGACEVIKNLASGKLSDYYKEFRENAGFSINRDVQQAIREGIANALIELEKTFYKENIVLANEREQIEFFFQSLSFQLGNAIESEIQINAYAFDQVSFFYKLLKAVNPSPSDEVTDISQRSVLEPDISDKTAQQLAVFLTKQLGPCANRYINEEFQTNQKAKTAYFIHLLEYSARTNQENNEMVSSILNDIGKHQQENTEILWQIAKAQQHIYDSIRKSQLSFKAYVSEFKDFKSRLDSQLEPSLRIPDYHNLNESFTYQYGLRYTSFISRETEIEKLWRFLNDQPDCKMLWLLITGPGGIGKSRLALEFCLEVQCINWYTGFVESNHIAGFDWSQWRPAFPTLFVVDYVAAYAEPTRQMIAQLSRNVQSKLLSKPVRVLLLEREIRDDWWSPFLADRDVIESSYILGSLNQIFNLPPFTDDDRWQIITEIHRKHGKTPKASKEEILQNLTEIDSKGRPLFAFLAGMALAEGEDIRHWDVHDLLNNVLQREEQNVWKTHPKWGNERCREGHKNLLALTTLTRGLTLSQLKDLFSQLLSWLPERQPDPSLYERLSDIREHEGLIGGKEKIYEGLQPDIVGEYYILKRLNQLLKDDFNGVETIQSLLTIGWALAPEEVWWSIWRTFSDFNHYPNTLALQQLLQSTPSKDSPEAVWECWQRLQFNLAHPDSYFKDKEQVYQKLKGLAEAYPHNEEIVLRQAQGAMNLTTYYGTHQQWVQAQASYSDLQILTKAYPHNEEIVLQQAMGAMNLTTYYGTHQQWVQAQASYSDLQILTKAYPHNEEIVLRQAQGAYNLTTDYGTHQQWVQAQASYSDLQILTKAYPHNEEIVLWQAKGAYNLTNNYGTHQQWVQAQASYSDLQTLTKAYPHNEEIVLWQAKGTYNLTTDYGTHQQWVQAQASYSDLQILTKAYPHNEEIVLRQAMGAYNLTTYYGTHQQWVQAQASYSDLQILTKAYPHNEEIVLWQAKGAYNLTTDYGTHQQWVQAQASYSDLQTLTKAYPHNEEIVLWQAKGTYNLTTDYGTHQQWVQAQASYSDLQTLTKAYPHNEEIVLWQAMGAYNLTTYYGTHQQWVQAQASYSDLQTLTKAYPHNEEIVLRQAKGAMNLTIDYGTHQQWVQAQASYSDLQTLTKAYPHNEEIVLRQAQGAYNLTTDYGTHQQWVQAQASYSDLQTLTKAYPHNEEIVLWQAMGAGSQVYFASEIEKIENNAYFLYLLQDLETLLTVYEGSKSWTKLLSLLKEICDNNQWLKS